MSKELSTRVKCAKETLGVGLKAFMDVILDLDEKDKLNFKIIDKLIVIEASFRAAIKELEEL